MTYRIMVVDDETVITDWVAHLLATRFGPAVEVYRHNDASAALRQLLTGLFDIAVLDISMPGISGIDILQELEAKRIGTRIIFLTAYGEFEYAKRAITPQVAAYILKGEPDEMLEQAVRDAMKRIEEQVETENLVRIARRRIEAAPTGIRREYLVRLLQGQGAPGPDGPQVPMLLSPEKGTRMLICALNGRDEEPPVPGLLLEMGAHIEEALGRSYVFEGVMMQNDSLVWLLQPRREEDAGPEPLLAVIEGAQTLYSRHTGHDLLFVHSSAPFPFAETGRVYQQLLPLLAFGYGKGHIVLAEEDLPEAGAAATPGEERSAPPLRRAPMLLSLLERGERKESLELLDEMLAPFGKLRPDGDPALLETYSIVSGVLLAALNRTGAYADISRRHPLVWLGDPHAFSSGEKAAEAFRRLAGMLLLRTERKKDGRSQACVEKAKEYIAAHLDQDLSLILLAEQVFLNPSYLSILFKNKAGCTVSDYIKGERLKKAEQLLAETRIKINEIARSVGYPNATYFGRFFKQETGLTPLEYRDRHAVREDRA